MSIIMANVEAEAIARNYIETIDDVAQEAHIVGSIRRLKPTTKDIDLVVLPKSYNELWARLDKQAQDGIIQKGDSWGKTYRNFTYNAANIELYTCTPQNRGYILWLRTGSADLTQYTMTKLKQHQSIVRFQAGSAWHVDYNTAHPNYEEKFGYAKLAQLKVHNEWGFFDLIGLPFINPPGRNKIAFGSLHRTVNNPSVEILKAKFYIQQNKPIKQLSMF